MSIKINKDRIQIGDYNICATSDGLFVDGKVYHDGCEQFTYTQGEIGIYNSGGEPSPSARSSRMDFMPFASVTTRASTGYSLCQNVYAAAAVNGITDGYAYGGNDFPPGLCTCITKFPFASCVTSLYGTTITSQKERVASTGSYTCGYLAGGRGAPGGPGITGAINKFPFACASFSSSSVGSLTIGKYDSGAACSLTHGYTSAGSTPPSPSPAIDGTWNGIDKWPFASDTNATCIGCLTRNTTGGPHLSSTECGYNLYGNDFGRPGSTPNNSWNAWPFASDTNATCVGTLGSTSLCGAGCGGSGFGCGIVYGPCTTTTVQSWTFASGNCCSNVGSLTPAACISGGMTQN